MPAAAQAANRMLMRIDSRRYSRASERNPLIGSGAHGAALGGNHQAVIRVESFANKYFADVRPVSVSRVDEVDPQVPVADEAPAGNSRDPQFPPKSA